MAKLEFLETGEELIDKWTINYKMPNGGMYNGILYVTGKRLVYDANFDLSLQGLAEAYLLLVGPKKYINFPKADIKEVEEKSSFFKKQVIITLANGDIHIFDYGMLSVKMLMEAIKK